MLSIKKEKLSVFSFGLAKRGVHTSSIIIVLPSESQLHPHKSGLLWSSHQGGLFNNYPAKSRGISSDT